MTEPKKYEDIEYNGKPARKYPDGSIRDENGRALALHPKMREITADTAREMVAKREEKRRRLYAEGAQLAVIDPTLLARYGEDAHIVERARTLQEIASTPDAGKAAVMADASLRKAQGLEDVQNAPIQAQNVYILQVEEYVARLLGGDNSNYRKHSEPDTIDAAFTDTSNEGDDPSGSAQGTG